MSNVKNVVILYLQCVLLIYLIAFLSLFIQIPGLYGSRGILPVNKVLKNDEGSVLNIFSTDQPSILNYFPKYLSGETGMDLICSIGIFLSIGAFLYAPLLNCFTFFMLWLLYMSLFQVGQTFLWFQWDTLLLELGLLSIILAPLDFNILPRFCRFRWMQVISGMQEHRPIGLWLVRWLSFRLMFCSGVVKLLSRCPTWWGLTALTYHYESQCIPTALSWFAHHLPFWLHRLSNAFVFIIQVGTSILFFSPMRLHRIASFFLQSMLMILILLTGNYNFFNLASIVICLSLVDDRWLKNLLSEPADKECRKNYKQTSKVIRVAKGLIHLVVVGVIAWSAIHYFNFKVDFANWKIDCQIGFTIDDFILFIRKFVPITILIAGSSLLVQILSSFLRASIKEVGLPRKILGGSACLFHGFVAIMVFSITLVPYTDIDPTSKASIPQTFKTWHQETQKFSIFNSYGLFRSMTGVGGRPEVIVEGSDRRDGIWEEYNFLYKPGALERAPPFVAPHQPRLDWQIWFAALSSYQHHPWFIGLVYRLLQNEKTVLDLMGPNPFPDAPPKYIRAQLYHYHYTFFNDSNFNDWWRREHVSEFLPIVSLSDEPFIKYLHQLNLLDNDVPNDSIKDNLLSKLFSWLHHLLHSKHGFLICTGVPLATVALRSFSFAGAFLAPLFAQKKERMNGKVKVK